MPPAVTLDDLRGYAVARTLFAPTTLGRAIDALGFVQADPIRAPARAQDLTLRHRVRNYRSGDLERRYPRLPIEEDFFVNYGFLPRRLQMLMHPRRVPATWTPGTRKQAQAVLDFVRERGAVHPRQVEAHFARGSVDNYWGGTSNATTRLLDSLHYRGQLRVVRRESGVRVYAAHECAPVGADAVARRANLDALVDVIVHKYAPLPAATLRGLVMRLRYGAPQSARDVGRATAHAVRRLARARVGGVDWYWPQGEEPTTMREAIDDRVRLLAPFDPVVWDRRRFELFWGWRYRFEAYYPPPKRKFGYYALPILWRDRVIGWANLSVGNGALVSEFGYAVGAPRSPDYRRELTAELERLRAFLRL
ncbi:MAG: crosslink repair DNA glycosylase YcaQ family protein [Betaproteobacteria bacterium]